MKPIHVCMSSFFDDRNSRRTGLSRFELGIAGAFVKAGAKLVTYSAPRRRMVALEFQRHVAPIARHQDELFESKHSFADPTKPPRATIMARYRAGMAASLGGSVVPHLRAMLLSPSAEIEPGDTLFVPGIVWSSTALAEMRRLHREYQVRIVPFIHDLIPIRRPEFHTDDEGILRFRHYADTMREIADRICVSSDFVAGDVRAFLAEKGGTNIPVVRVPLCPDITQATMRRSTPRLDAMSLEPDGFALYVSTLNVRKNHEWLSAIWRRLSNVVPESTLPLVIAGQRGWGVDELIRKISDERAACEGSVRFVEAPSDAEVAHLYSNCAFTVFPSHYEGWGLGVTESLEFGKPCIAADNTALGEAGQSLAIHIDLQDDVGWINAIRRMSQDRAYRHRLSAIIRRDYKPRTWETVGREMMTALTIERC